MTASRMRNSVSRRTALAGLGAGGLGVALAAARPAAAQDAAAEMAKHPIVGFWQLDSGPNPPTGRRFDFLLIHADGTHNDWNGLAAGSALGIWRPTGERTADFLSIYLDTDPSTAAEAIGTATFRMTITVDDTGDAYTADGSLDLRDANGAPIVTLPAHWTCVRITFDHNPATGSTMATPTAATPTS